MDELTAQALGAQDKPLKYRLALSDGEYALVCAALDSYVAGATRRLATASSVEMIDAAEILTDVRRLHERVISLVKT